MITSTGILDSTTIDGSLQVKGPVRIENDEMSSTLNVSSYFNMHGSMFLKQTNGMAMKVVASGSNYSIPAVDISYDGIFSETNTLMRLASSKASKGVIVDIDATNLHYGTGMRIDASNLNAGVALEVIGGSDMEDGSLVHVATESTGALSPVQFHADYVDGGSLLKIESNSISSGSALRLEMTQPSTQASALSASGTMLHLEIDGEKIGQGLQISAKNMEEGTLMDISSEGDLTTGKLLSVMTTSDVASNPILFQADYMTDGDLMKISAEKLVHGSALLITSEDGNSLECDNSDNSETCGSMLNIDGRKQSNGALLRINAPDIVEGAAIKIEGGSENSVLLDVYTTAMHSPKGILKIDAPSVRTGKIVNIETSALVHGSAILVKHTGLNVLKGNLVRIEGGTNREGTLLDIDAPYLVNGTAVRIQGGNTNGKIHASGKLLEIISTCSGSGDPCEAEAVVDIKTTSLASGSLVSLHGEELNDDDASILKVVADEGSIGGGGAIVHVSTGDVTEGNAINVEAHSLTKGNGVLIQGGKNLGKNGFLLKVISEGASSSGVVSFSSTNVEGGNVFKVEAKEMASGNVFELVGEMPEDHDNAGASNLLSIEAINGVSTGTMLNVHGKDLTNGTGVKIVAENLIDGSALQVNSFGNDPSSKHPVVAFHANGLQGGSVLSVVSNSDSTEFRSVSEIINNNENAKNTQVLRLVHNSKDTSTEPTWPAAALAIETFSHRGNIFTCQKR